MLTYTEVQALWYHQLSTVGLWLFALIAAVIIVKKSVSNPIVFKFVLMILFAVPIALAEFLSWIKS